MEWISVDDRLPEESQHGDRFLVYDKYGFCVADFFDDTCGATSFDGVGRLTYKVSHWSHLATPKP